MVHFISIEHFVLSVGQPANSPLSLCGITLKEVQFLFSYYPLLYSSVKVYLFLEQWYFDTANNNLLPFETKK